MLALQFVSLAIIHSSINTGTSLLFDNTLSVLTIVLTEVILSRRAAFVWFLIHAVSFILAMKTAALAVSTS